MVSESSRMWASASFVGVLIVIGLPLWWKTTEVYRVTLPFDKINEFGSQALIVATEVTVLANDEASAAEVVGMIEEAFQDHDIIRFKINKKVLDNDLHHHLNTVADDQEAVELISETYDLMQYNHIYVVQRKPLLQDVWMATERVVFFRDSASLPILTKVLDSWIYQSSVLRNAAASRESDEARRTRFPPAEAYHVVLSVVHPAPDKLQIDFDAGEAVEDYIGSFVDELSVLHNFTLKSQWLHLLDFDFQSKEVKDSSEWGRHFAVKLERMPLLLTRLETRAATHVSQHPTLNLALYALPCARAPLRLYRDDEPVSASTQAFMSAKWGGVVLDNPSHSDCREELEGTTSSSSYRPLVRLVMGTFIAQLRELLGIVKTEYIEGATVSPLRDVRPRRWEVDALLRTRTVEQLTTAQLTLTSLAQLLGEISNIVINDEVGASIKSAVENIEAATVLLARGQLLEAYKTSQAAFLASEAAFMDPSLLALLYFPDDQKYAIYIPLFLPIMFPVVLSLKNLLLWLRGKNAIKEKTD